MLDWRSHAIDERTDHPLGVHEQAGSYKSGALKLNSFPRAAESAHRIPLSHFFASTTPTGFTIPRGQCTPCRPYAGLGVVAVESAWGRGWWYLTGYRDLCFDNPGGSEAVDMFVMARDLSPVKIPVFLRSEERRVGKEC